MKKNANVPSPNRGIFRKSRFRHSIFLESYGVKIRIGASHVAAIDEIKKLLPSSLADCYQLTDDVEVDHEFSYVWNTSERDSLYKNGDIFAARTPREPLLDRLASLIRLTVAEFAVGRVFLHAGVVALNGKALVFPARSLSGKSTLVAELVRRGAIYYSDEYAVLDENGWVSPFAKMLSIRSGPIGDYTQVDHPVESFGGTAGTVGIPVGMVLITKFKAGAKWKPALLPGVKGMMEIIPNTVPIRNDPALVLEVLKKLTNTAVIVESPRGEVTEFADHILGFFESACR